MKKEVRARDQERKGVQGSGGAAQAGRGGSRPPEGEARRVGARLTSSSESPGANTLVSCPARGEGGVVREGASAGLRGHPRPERGRYPAHSLEDRQWPEPEGTGREDRGERSSGLA